MMKKIYQADTLVMKGRRRIGAGGSAEDIFELGITNNKAPRWKKQNRKCQVLDLDYIVCFFASIKYFLDFKQWKILGINFKYFAYTHNKQFWHNVLRNKINKQIILIWINMTSEVWFYKNLLQFKNGMANSLILIDTNEAVDLYCYQCMTVIKFDSAYLVNTKFSECLLFVVTKQNIKLCTCTPNVWLAKSIRRNKKMVL